MAPNPTERPGGAWLAFGPFELDLLTGELQNRGNRVELAALPARLLRYLAANRGRIVAKGELAVEIWGAADVGEATIQQAIRTARLAVGDDGRSQRVIRTASRVGYRFVAPVRGDDAGAPSRSALPFVGRRALLGSCEQRLAALCASQGSLLLLSGAAGIGKSRVLDEIGHLAGRRGLAVVRGGEGEPEGAPPFWPWIDVFCELSAIRPLEELRTRVPHLLGLDAGEEFPTTEPERFGHFAVAARCLRRAADLGPLVILLEDLHRAGAYSWELLERVATASLHAPLLVVATHRPLPISADQIPARILHRIVTIDRVSRSDVGPLSDIESAYLVELASGRRLPAEQAAAVSSGTGGSPLVAIEFARLLQKAAEQGLDAEWQELIGESITRLLEVRLAPLAGEVRSLLVTAATIGTTFEAAILMQASRSEDPWRALEGAIAERLVAELRPGSGVYRFSHALIRDALYAELANESERCRRIHLRIADAIAAVDPTRHSELAHHTCAAGHLAGAARIAGAAERAARSAARGGEIDAAFAIYERALSALADGGALDAEVFCTMSVAAGELGVRSVRPDAARAILDAAIGTARQLGRSDLFARASLARVYRTEIVGTADPAVIALLEEAIAGLAGALPELAAQLRSRVAVELRYASEGPGRALALVERAMAEAEACGHARARARVLEDASLVRWSVSDPAGWLELNRRIEEAAREAGDIELAFQGCKGIATGHLELCRRDEFDREVDRCAATAEAYPSPFLRAVVSGLLASQAFLDGDFDRAEQQVLDAAASGLEELAALSAAQIFYHRLETGRLGELESATRMFMRESPGIATWQVALARLLVDDGRLAEARDTLADLPSLDRIAKDRNWLPGLAMLSECAVALEDRDLANRLFAELAPHAAVAAVLGNATVFYGAGAHHLGILCVLLRRTDEADRYLDQAFTLHDALRSEPWRLRTLVQQARVLAMRGHGAIAIERAGDVARRATALGMVRCADAAADVVSTAR